MNINCSVCRELLFSQADEIYSTPCGHVFHHACLLQWIKRFSTCPQCHKTTTATNIFKIYFNFSDRECILKDEIEKTKTDALLKNTEEKLKIKCDEISQLTINYEQLQKQILEMKVSIKQYIDQLHQATESRDHTQRQAKVGELVVIKDFRKAPLQWNLGEVITKCPESNETVTLRTYCDEIKSNIAYLLPLDLWKDQTQWQAKVGQWVVITYVSKAPLLWNLGQVVDPHPESGIVKVKIGSCLSNRVESCPQSRLFPLPHF